MKEEELIDPQELKEVFPKGEQDEASEDENVEVSCLYFLETENQLILENVLGARCSILGIVSKFYFKITGELKRIN